MSTTSPPDPVVPVREFVHSIAQDLHALDRLVRHELYRLDDPTADFSLGIPGSAAQEHSLYEMLQNKLADGHIPYYVLSRIMLRLLRELDLFANGVANLIGFFDQTGDAALALREVSLEQLLKEIVDLFQAVAEEKGVDLELFLPELPLLRVDRALVRRALVNLVDNAIKYSYSTSSHGRKRFVTIRARRHSPRGDCLVEVCSYGVGIEEDELRSGLIYQYGRRGRLAMDRERRGTGIGLAETKRIVEVHGGKIEVKSDLVAGDVYITTVRVVLPGN